MLRRALAAGWAVSLARDEVCRATVSIKVRAASALKAGDPTDALCCAQRGLAVPRHSTSTTTAGYIRYSCNQISSTPASILISNAPNFCMTFSHFSGLLGSPDTFMRDAEKATAPEDALETAELPKADGPGGPGAAADWVVGSAVAATEQGCAITRRA